MGHSSSDGISPLLLHEIHSTVEESRLPATLRRMVLEALKQPGHALASPPGLKWPTFVTLCCESASGGEWVHSVPAAAAFEFMTASLEIVDDLQDGDVGPLEEKYGEAQALNTGFELFVLAHRALQRLRARHLSAARCLRVVGAFSAAAAAVGSGQHLDLLYETKAQVTQEDCLEAAGLKSATLVSAAFRIGAMLGTSSQSLVEKYASLGWNLGMYAQLANDLRDVLPGESAKSDIRRSKKTLPLTFAAAERKESHGDLTGRDEEAIRQHLLETGALHYTLAVAADYREKARDVLARIDKVRPAAAVLGRFISPQDLPDALGRWLPRSET